MVNVVETDLGEFHGRDAIYLDSETFLKEENVLVLNGEFNGSLCSRSDSDDFIPYSIRFIEVSEYTKTDLDDWEFDSKPAFHESSSFYSFEEESFTVYVFQTYDIVFEVRCKTYVLSIGQA